jgi:tetratricopeptide (TPR) repeat protein/transcriptional regulator with XRE-family HTH domain
MAADFAIALREARRRAELTQEDAAERCGLSVRTLRNLETGRHQPRRSTIELIVDGLDLDEHEAAGLRAAGAGDDRYPAERTGGPLIPHQLPAESRHFAGREAELRRLDEMAAAQAAQAPGLVVVCGGAGVGKTALVVRWARSHAKAYAHGEVFVDLRGFGPGAPVEPAESLTRLLVQIGAEPRGTALDDLVAAWRSALDDRQVLLVLDNAATAEQVRPLLPANPDCCVVVTSRNTLAGLVARDGAERLQLDVLPSQDSSHLLLSVIGGPAHHDLAGVRRLAKACGHLPLALRIAAELALARTDIGLGDLAERLERDPLRELDTPGDPHTALRAVLMSSYRALPASAARALRLLGVHPAPVFDRTVAAVLLGLPPGETATQLDLLLRAHMIMVLGEGVFTMHDLLYAFARDLSHEDAAENTAAFARLVDHLLFSARTAVTQLDSANVQWLAEKRGVLVATAVRAGRSGLYQAAVDFADVLGKHLEETAAYAELLVLLEEASQAAERLGRTGTVAEIQRRMGVAHYRLGQPEPAIAAAHRALAAFRAVNDRRGEARCLMNIGSVHWRSGFSDEGLVWYERALSAYRIDGDEAGAAGVLSNIGTVLKERGRNDAALRYYNEALLTYQRLGERRFQSVVLVNIGEMYLKLGQFADAFAMQTQAAALARETGNRHDEGIALTNLGDISLRQGHDREARRYFVLALQAARDVGDRIGEGLVLDCLGTIHHRRGDLQRAERAYRQGLVVSQETRNRDGECLATLHLAKVTLDRDHVETAERLAADAVLLAGEPVRLAQTLNVLAEVEEAIGDYASALNCRRRALANLRRVGDVSELPATLQGLEAHHAKHGSEKLAAAYRRIAATVGGLTR